MAIDEKEEREAFNTGYAAASAEIGSIFLTGRAPDTEGKELAYDRWVRLGRDLRTYLKDKEWLDKEEHP